MPKTTAVEIQHVVPGGGVETSVRFVLAQGGHVSIVELQEGAFERLIEGGVLCREIPRLVKENGAIKLAGFITLADGMEYLVAAFEQRANGSYVWATPPFEMELADALRPTPRAP